MAQAMKIAIIDDEQDMRQSISQWLALSGFETETFASAGDALKGLSADYPGIIVTDIKMPGMDGIETARHFLGQKDSPAVVFCTAFEEHAIKAFELQAVGYLLKPVRKEHLIAALDKSTRLNRLQLASLHGVDETRRAHICART